MRYRRDLSYAEIGRLLGVSRVSAWHLHRRAVRVLRRHDANETPYR